MTISELLHTLKPVYRDCTHIECIRTITNDLQQLIEQAHKALAEIHEPNNLGTNLLTDWPGYAPLQLEYREDDNGTFTLEFIRVRGVRIPDFYLDENLWVKADAEVASWTMTMKIQAKEQRAEWERETQHAA